MHSRFHIVLRKAGTLFGAALLGMLIWVLALLAAARYRSANEALAQTLRDFAVPVSAVIAALLR